jgi:hypothetical protein
MKDEKPGLLKRLLTAGLEPLIEDAVRERAVAASVPAYRAEDEGWRKLTGPNATRDLIGVTQERMQEIGVYLAESNPMGKWILDVLADFIVADGLPFEADNEDVAQALEDFWYDPLNNFEVYFRKHVREKRIFGEQCLPAFTARQTGYLRLGYIDPVQIDKVITDPENVKMAIGVVIKGSSGEEGRRLKTILPADAEYVMSPVARQLRDTFTDGECFFSAVNNLTNSPRGRSELLVSADWLDAYEQFLFDCADRWPLLNSFMWDVSVNGGDVDTIKKEVESITKKAGSVYGHNQNVTLQAITPDLKTQDVDTGARVVRNHILGTHGYPEVWYGGGGDANRASSVEMGTPAFKMLSSKQREEKAAWELIFQTVIDRRRAAGTLTCTEEDAKNWSIVLPELVSKDITKNSAAIQQVTASLGQAITQEIIDRETARKVLLFLLGSLGIEIDEQDVADRLEEEIEKRRTQDYGEEPGPVLPLEGGGQGSGVQGQGVEGRGTMDEGDKSEGQNVKASLKARQKGKGKKRK